MMFKTSQKKELHLSLICRLLAGAFVLITFSIQGKNSISKWARALAGIWLLQNLILISSSFWRLCLYVEVYSLTRLRVATMIWMLIVGLGFLWLILYSVQRQSKIWLFNRNAVTLIVVLYLSSFVNFDEFITRYNVLTCEEITGHGVSLDLDYLEHIGAASIPALNLLDAEIINDDFRRQATSVKNQLQSNLSNQLVNWRTWTLYKGELISEINLKKSLE